MRHALISVGWGFGGVVIALLLWHLYQDHLLVDAIRQNSIQQMERLQQQQQQMRLPSPPQ